LFIAKIIRNGFLIQNAFDNIDNYTDTRKLLGFIKIILLLYKECKDLLDQGFIIEDCKALRVINDILRISYSVSNEDFSQIEKLKKELINEIEYMKLTRGVPSKK